MCTVCIRPAMYMKYTLTVLQYCVVYTAYMGHLVNNMGNVRICYICIDEIYNRERETHACWCRAGIIYPIALGVHISAYIDCSAPIAFCANGTVPYGTVATVRYGMYRSYGTYSVWYLVPGTWFLVCIHVHLYASVFIHTHPSRIRMHPYACIRIRNASEHQYQT